MVTMQTILNIWLIVTLLIVTPDAPPALVVTLRDAQGAPIAGVAITVVDLSGATIFDRAMTDAAGTVRFAALPVNNVRVQLTGRLADATPLRQSAADERGMLVMLDMPPTRLDLRIEPDGTVIPDPITMIAPDLGVPLAETFPTAIRIAPPTATSLIAATPAVPATTTPEPSSALLIPGLALAIILILVCGVALLALTRREQL